MSVKQIFLHEVRSNLRKYPANTVDDYIDYYDELISERIANGETERDVLRTIGTPKEVAASFKQDNAIGKAVSKPTVSNGLKALLAVLGVLSLPLLIPVAIVVALLVFIVALLIGVGFVVLASSILTAILSVFDITVAVIAGDAPLYLLLLVIGGALVVVFLAFELLRGLLFVSRGIIRRCIQKLEARRLKRKQRHESQETR